MQWNIAFLVSYPAKDPSLMHMKQLMKHKHMTVITLHCSMCARETTADDISIQQAQSFWVQPEVETSYQHQINGQ